MEARPLVRKRLAPRGADALLSRAQSAEVLDRLGDGLAVEAHDDAAGGLAADVDVEKDLFFGTVLEGGVFFFLRLRFSGFLFPLRAIDPFREKEKRWKFEARSSVPFSDSNVHVSIRNG